MRKKILLFTAFVPNESGAAEKNTMLMVNDLSKHFNIDIAYFKYRWQDNYTEPNDFVKVINVFEINSISKIINCFCHPFTHPLFSVRFNRNINCWLQQTVNNNTYDAIIFEHSQLFMFAKTIKTNAKCILFSHDVIYQRVSRSQNALMAYICKRAEKQFLTMKHCSVVTISAKDSNLVKKLYNVDSEYSVAYIDKKIIDSLPQKIENKYVFIGKWSRADNLDGVLWFFEKVVPLIKSKIDICILGRDFPKEKIKNTNANVCVSIPGFVDNPYSMIANAKALLAPIFTGAGVKQKVLESLACGTPIIGTDVAFEGISLDYEEFMKLASTPKEFAYYIDTVNYDVPKRIEMKRKFLSNYGHHSMTNYLLKIL